MTLLTFTVRLVDGSTPYEGRVELYYQGQWGSVCSSGFDLREANVVCQQLGYPSAARFWRGNHFGQGSGPILLHNVGCYGFESRIDMCYFRQWYSGTCEASGVTCNDHVPQGEQFIADFWRTMYVFSQRHQSHLSTAWLPCSRKLGQRYLRSGNWPDSTEVS